MAIVLLSSRMGQQPWLQTSWVAVSVCLKPVRAAVAQRAGFYAEVNGGATAIRSNSAAGKE